MDIEKTSFEPKSHFQFGKQVDESNDDSAVIVKECSCGQVSDKLKVSHF